MSTGSRAGWIGRPVGKALVSVAAGAFTAASLPPVDFLPALFGFAALYWIARISSSFRAALFQAWCWGFGYHVAGLYWISNALLVDGDQHAWLVPFAAAGLPAFLAFFFVVGVLSAKLWVASAARLLGGFSHETRATVSNSGVALWALLAAFLSLTEWLRGHILTGFPWNLPAQAWDSVPAMTQALSVVGAYGLSFITVLTVLAPALLLDRTVRRRSAATVVSVMTIGILLIGVWGGERLASADPDRAAGVVIRVVQGNVPQRDKWNPSLKPEHIRRYLDLSDADRPPTVREADLPVDAVPTVVVWPETAVTFLLTGRDDDLSAISGAAPIGGSLVFGAPRIGEAAAGSVPPLHNSVFAIGRSGGVQWTYDKFHLVPFGEYVPLRNVLPIDPIVQGKRDFAPGPGPETFSLSGAPAVSPLVCYEVIFPGNVQDESTEPRPVWLLNLTNDAWYGRSAGPYQHFSIARFRSIEEGASLVRAANTGISAVIDPYGRVLARLDLGRTGAIDSALYLPIPNTIYATYGDMLFFTMLIIAACFSVLMLSLPVFRAVKT